jgi:hypothetical protein
MKTPEMIYFKTKIKTLRWEYNGKDRKSIIAKSGNKCSMCGRIPGDVFMFGPTHYIRKKIRFKVRMDVHIIEGMPGDKNKIVLCDGCHMSYHWFNRLSEDAEFGNKKLNETLYDRCETCKELSCMCCKKCSNPIKYCQCKPIKRTNGCSKHPRYGGIRKPRTSCEVCLDLWVSNKSNPGDGTPPSEGTVRVR